MPKITISNQGQKVVNYKLNNESPLTVLAILQENNIDWMHACGGKGKCTSCKCNVITGESSLRSRTEVEKDFLIAGRISESQRMTCQAVPLGDIEIEVPEKNKLPGVNYTN
ncbi:MAG: (2Fe-2S)-binding protein [Cyclobacteriaceae bacterium]|nr:(2Fe-2S)-binding protein [Cyclobacteriaceae bacterium]